MLPLLAMHSSPRFSSWVWFNDWKVLIDAGDGVSATLGYKLRKIDTMLLTHSHRDHVGGLVQAINQRGEAGPFTLGHPVRGRAWGQVEEFSRRFNPGASHQAVWRALEEGDWIESGVEGRLLRAFRTRHFVDDDPQFAPRSLGYQLVWRKNKLRAEFASWPQSELARVGREQGSATLTEPVDELVACISGDTCPLDPAMCAGAELLLHEATFLHPDDYDSEEGGDEVGHMHSTVHDALRVAREAEVPNVVLYHISTRYTDAAIRDAVREAARELGLRARVWAILPRRVYWDVFRDKPTFEPE